MNTLTKHHRFFNIVGILLLVSMLLGSTTPALAAPHGSDISITIVANRSTVKVGQNITYTARMTNHGPDDAYFVDTAFVLPKQLTLVEETCAEGISPDTPNCEYSSLKAGQTVISKLVATPKRAAHPYVKDIKVTARVLFETSGTVDPHLHNNVDSVSTVIFQLPAHP
jgi:uncharacterized repeat protein (TIGR01451 family)